MPEYFKVVTPAGEWELTSEEFIEFCSNVSRGFGNECFEDAKRKAEEMWQANQNWLPDAY
jgi:hypothetical protein